MNEVLLIPQTANISLIELISACYLTGLLQLKVKGMLVEMLNYDLKTQSQHLSAVEIIITLKCMPKIDCLVSVGHQVSDCN